MHCSLVTELEVYQVNDAAYELVRQLPGLEELDISFRNCLATNLPEHFQLNNLRKLRAECHGVDASDAIMCDFISNCPQLTHFSILYGYSLNVQVATTLISGLTKLTALNLHELQVDDAALTAIVDGCPLMEHLDLRNSLHITDTGVKYAVQKLRLKSIAFNCANEITDRGLYYLRYCRGTLRALHISQTVGYSVVGRSKFTLSAVNDLLSTSNIREYDWCTTIIGENFDFKICAHAVTIVVSTMVTDALLHKIALHCKQLQFLDIVVKKDKGAPQYTSAGLYAIIRNCFLLKTIRVNKSMEERQYGVVMNLYKELFICSHCNTDSIYDVMER